MKYTQSLLVFAALFMVSAPALAAPAAKNVLSKDRSNLPITIKSDELSADNKGRTAIFTGKVVAKQGDFTIFADKLSINYGDKKGTVEKVVADGNVRFIRDNSSGSASHAVYDNRVGRITLTGNSRVMQGIDTIVGNTIICFIDEDRCSVSGGRVEATIHPEAGKKNVAPR